LNPLIKKYRISPDSVFVGKEYGVNIRIPKILFIGNNPNSKLLDFGTLKSILDAYGPDFESSIDSHTFYTDYFHGKRIKSKKYSGLKSFELYKDPEREYHIVSILKKILPQIKDNKYPQCFAIANGVHCMGFKNSDRGTPHKKMRENCMVYLAWIRKIIETLEPDVTLIFSLKENDSTWASFTVDNGVVDHKSSLNQWKFAYRGKIKTLDNGDFTSKIFAIPHLTISNFCSNLFRAFFPKLTFGERVEKLLEIISSEI
jgi:hypothetical protein